MPARYAYGLVRYLHVLPCATVHVFPVRHVHVLPVRHVHVCLYDWRIWQGRKDSNPRMLESKSSALTNLATPLHRLTAENQPPTDDLSLDAHPTRG